MTIIENGIIVVGKQREEKHLFLSKAPSSSDFRQKTANVDIKSVHKHLRKYLSSKVSE